LLFSGCQKKEFTTFVSFSPKTEVSVTPDDITVAARVLQTRLNAVLSGEAIVTYENDLIRVGLTDKEDLLLTKELATTNGLFEFFHSTAPINIGEPIPENALTIMTGKDIKNASVYSDSNTNSWVVDISLTKQGTDILADFSKSHIGEYLVISRDKMIIFSLQINSAITDGEAEIQGSFDKVSARILAAELNSGCLPVQLIENN
jgi:preprotein translocase subunit SecD